MHRLELRCALRYHLPERSVGWAQKSALVKGLTDQLGGKTLVDLDTFTVRSAEFPGRGCKKGCEARLFPLYGDVLSAGMPALWSRSLVFGRECMKHISFLSSFEMLDLHVAFDIRGKDLAKRLVHRYNRFRGCHT